LGIVAHVAPGARSSSNSTSVRRTVSTWHFARPPVQGLDFEMDVRGVAHEFVI
jgi:hypothetical protein